ncbi:interferon-inducible GTPase-domain-containing protein [Sparassis latifolia]|uniref:IRG-type G domain-containing protein n=1 Tax=Sparassis crispa TaxID=139825 RepID=A0A401GLY4_9APHY|nr:hypothetical protein SCP_0502700 [Sparassis crispa]GBE83223.1 hypothetical protein SCP_0502700 [Sparassis crispa]
MIEVAGHTQETDQRLIARINPEIWPTQEEIHSAMKRIDYQDGVFHCAVAGIAGSGKSSLINAIRGLSNSKSKHPDAAEVGSTETTRHVTRYPDPNPKKPVVWYDIPGAGTLTVPSPQYFNAQGLFLFDCIIVLFDNRFTETDVSLLHNCSRFNIPSYIVRSKSNQGIKNTVEEMREDDEECEDSLLYERARERFTARAKESVRENLSRAGLLDQRVYIVCRDGLRKVVKPEENSQVNIKVVIDEEVLLQDLLKEAYDRRVEDAAVAKSALAERIKQLWARCQLAAPQWVPHAS